jgi:hypothetical protein
MGRKLQDKSGLEPGKGSGNVLHFHLSHEGQAPFEFLRLARKFYWRFSRESLHRTPGTSLEKGVL